MLSKPRYYIELSITDDGDFRAIGYDCEMFNGNIGVAEMADSADDSEALNHIRNNPLFAHAPIYLRLAKFEMKI